MQRMDPELAWPGSPDPTVSFCPGRAPILREQDRDREKEPSKKHLRPCSGSHTDEHATCTE